MRDLFIAAVPWVLGIGIFALAALVFGAYVQHLYAKGCAITPKAVWQDLTEMPNQKLSEKFPAEGSEEV